MQKFPLRDRSPWLRLGSGENTTWLKSPAQRVVPGRRKTLWSVAAALLLTFGACTTDPRAQDAAGADLVETGSGVATGATGAGTADPAPAGTGEETGVDVEIASIEIAPAAPLLEVVDGVLPPGVQLQATGVTAGGDRVALEGNWEVDRVELASVDGFTGLLVPSGVAGGVVNVTFSSAFGQAHTTATVKLHLHDDGGVDEGVRAEFGGGGAADPNLALLYPYEGTVFPRDLAGPLVQWTGASPTDTYYLHLTAPTFEYEAWITGLEVGRYAFPVGSTDPWRLLTASVVAQDVQVSLQRYDGAQAYAPVTSAWHIADAALVGTIYYWEVNNGSIVRLKVGDPAPEPFLAKPAGVGCVACHSVSADGGTLVASFDGGESPWGTFETANGASRYATNSPSGFQAISPDGDYVVWGQSGDVANLSTADSASILAMLPVTGGAPVHPAWSPDGTRLAYAVRTDGGWLDFTRSTLWVADVDLVTPGFANARQLVGPTPGRPTITYPSWSPDSQWIAFGRGTQARTRGGQGELALVDAAGTRELALGRACGVGTLQAAQSSACFEPTFMPESRGGYFWLVFVSERTYGNVLTDTDPTTRHKQLWITAIEDPPQPGSDPSHPAFWLPGQELDNQNMRGAWTFEPGYVPG